MENDKTQPFDLEPTKRDNPAPLKSYPLDQIIDEHIGRRGTPEREKFERDIEEGMKVVEATAVRYDGPRIDPRYVQVETDAEFLGESGNILHPVATLASPHGGRCQIDIDDHCYRVHVLMDRGYVATTYIFPEAMEVLRTLPPLAIG